jgi:hypothetical protein
VAALSDTDVWSVGTTGKGADQASVIAHWVSGTLELTTGPKGESLYGVAAVSPSDVWAVGAGKDGALLEHWDGAGWTRQTTPRGIQSLDDVIMTSDSVGWAVGVTLDGRPAALRWDGSTWRLETFVRSPNVGELYSVAASSENDVWAVGEMGNEGSINFIDGYAVRWNGQRWHAFAVPARDDSDLGYEQYDGLYDVSAASGTNAWAVHAGSVRSDLQRWRGRRWRIVRVFRPGLHLYGVTALRGQAWAYGSRSGHPALLRWNGHR